MSKHRIIIAVALLVYVAIIFLPPIIHGYIYPNIGDDTAAHMNIFDGIGLFAPEGKTLEQIRYGAIYIVGYPLDALSYASKVDNDTLFMWFNYLALAGVGITLFFIFKNLLGITAGLLALLIPMFSSYAMLLLFYSGVIFEIINIGIILPLVCYYVTKYLMTKSKRYSIGAICLGALFAVFHSTGIYMPFILIAGFVAFIVYKIVKREHIKKWTLIWGLIGITGCISLFIFFNPILENISQTMAVPSIGISGFPLLQKSLFYYMSYLVFVIFIASMALLVREYKNLKAIEKLIISTFGLLALIMLPAVLFGWSPQPFRQGIALAVFLSIVSVASVGVLFRFNKHRLVAYIIVCLAVGGGAINIGGWFGYNSALEEVDIEAIHYVNTLPGDTYSCADNVDHWIYSRYVDKEYFPLHGEILVIRNVPMKSKVALVDEGDLIGDKKYMAVFVDGETEVIVYK